MSFSHSLPACLMPSVKANPRYSLGWGEGRNLGAPRVKGCLDVNWSPFSSLIFEDSCPLCLFPQDFRTMVRPRTRCSLALLAPQKPSVTLG